ncbi:30S ribosomal protein S15 [Candidatus Berkelbacteria bacterium]|nr:30S ribosomal protein S15 [Candidatus Berkelbacteria bacterium]
MATKKPTDKPAAKKTTAKPVSPRASRGGKPAVAAKKAATSAKAVKTPVAKAVAETAAKPSNAPVKQRATKAKAAAKPTSGAIIDKYQTHKGDTGSTQVQVARISLEIDELAGHLKKHPKDHDSRRGLLIMVGKRRRLLNYLKRQDEPTYQSLIVDLKLRK